MTVVTGLTGVGKSTILRKSEQENVIILDDIIKDYFYKRDFKLYWDIKETFGDKFVKYFKVDTNSLGKLVLSDSKKLFQLDKLVMPYIKAYLSILKRDKVNYIVEMAVYRNYESDYKKFFDRVILVERKVNRKNKFSYANRFVQLVKKNNIKADILIDDEDIDSATKKLNNFLRE